MSRSCSRVKMHRSAEHRRVQHLHKNTFRCATAQRHQQWSYTADCCCPSIWGGLWGNFQTIQSPLFYTEESFDFPGSGHEPTVRAASLQTPVSMFMMKLHVSQTRKDWTSPACLEGWQQSQAQDISTNTSWSISGTGAPHSHWVNYELLCIHIIYKYNSITELKGRTPVWQLSFALFIQICWIETVTEPKNTGHSSFSSLKADITPPPGDKCHSEQSKSQRVDKCQ